MPIRTRTRRLLARAAVATAALALVTAASAQWSLTGTGSGVATAAATATVTIAPASPTAALYPGDAADVAARLENAAPGATRVRVLALDAARGADGFAVDAAHAGCDLSALAFTPVAGDWTVPGDGDLVVHLHGALALAADASDACQGATFTVYLAAR